MAASVGFPDTTIDVGHSNGGVVSRDANRAGRNFKGIITVGTPHQGAGIAANVLNGEFSQNRVISARHASFSKPIRFC